MAVRDQNLESIGEIFATFAIHQTGGADDLTDDDIGYAVTLTDDNEVGPGTDGALLMGKLTALTLQDGDDGNRSTAQYPGCIEPQGHGGSGRRAGRCGRTDTLAPRHPAQGQLLEGIRRGLCL